MKHSVQEIEEIEFMLEDLQKPFRARGLNEWEENFIQSLAQQWEERGSLTDNQLSKLRAIYNEV